VKILHRGREQFLKGTFGGGGDNLFVDAKGAIRRIMDNDLNGDGIFDLVLPNSHGYIERAPTYIYSKKNGGWEKTQLPHDSCWMPIAVDVDGDGYLDLIIANGENGVSSELKSYIYWGGPNGLTGECTVFDTIGAYDAAAYDLTGNGLKDVIFTTAWYDHHNAGVPLHQKVFVQTSPRKFTDATEQYRIPGLAVISLLCEDLNGDGRPEIVLANYRKKYEHDTDSFLYMGKAGGFDTEHPVRLPTHYAQKVLAADLNGDGFKELIFTGGSQVMIFWNEKGVFKAENRLVLNIKGLNSQFSVGVVPIDIADVDGDGVLELVIGTIEGVEVRKANDLKAVWKKLPCYSCLGVKAADIRNTGRMDIIASHYCSAKSYDAESLVFWNDEDGYRTDNVTAFETHGAVGCTAADLDNDGIKEVIFCNTMMGPSQFDLEFPVFAYYGTPDYKYKAENRRDYPVKFGSNSYAVADVDNDGHVELVVTHADGLRIFKGTPQGPNPSDYYDLVHTPGTIVGIGGVLAGDFNRDGWLDLIMTPWMYGNSEKELENSVFVYAGGPKGFSDKRRMVLPAYLECANAIQLADIDNDGYVDFLYGDKGGFIGVYYGGPDGFRRERFGKIPLKEHNGALILGITVADVDKDGWLELFVTTGGHYTRRTSHLYILKDGRNGFPVDRQFMFETGGTTGFPELADLRKSGDLDLLLPFYSTHLSRELPARIFRGDGKGDFDWKNPLIIDCLASIAFFPVDLTGNGYPDVFICCHRNNLGHIVNSKLIMNGPEGLDIEHTQEILGYGPHCFTNKNQGNSWDKSDTEYYTSPVFECRKPRRLEWEGKTPFKTSLSFRVRFGRNEAETLKSRWSESITESGGSIRTPEGTGFMQYQVAFHAPGLVNSPRLTSVSIECEA
jgi:hypothetical protein